MPVEIHPAFVPDACIPLLLPPMLPQTETVPACKDYEIQSPYWKTMTSASTAALFPESFPQKKPAVLRFLSLLRTNMLPCKKYINGVLLLIPTNIANLVHTPDNADLR